MSIIHPDDLDSSITYLKWASFNEIMDKWYALKMQAHGFELTKTEDRYLSALESEMNMRNPTRDHNQ